MLEAVKVFYKDSKASIRIDGVKGECFEIGIGVKQGYVMSPWLFNVYMDGVMKEVNMSKQGEGPEFILNGKKVEGTNMSIC